MNLVLDIGEWSNVAIEPRQVGMDSTDMVLFQALACDLVTGMTMHEDPVRMTSTVL